jgi:glycosyltransferase involved in cell wall biosynthesis
VKADEPTVKEVFSIRDPKVEIYWEDVPNKGELTHIENIQIEKSKGDWIWSLEDDELWPEEDLRGALSLLNDNVDGLGVVPFNMANETQYNPTINGPLTKFFRREGTYWKRPFPKNGPRHNGAELTARKNNRVPWSPYTFFHMVLMKEASFRNEPEWFPNYGYRSTKRADLPEKYRKALAEILHGEDI